MPEEQVLNGFILRVAVRAHKLVYNLQSLKTGNVETFESLKDAFSRIEYHISKKT